ncbi:hypothetical protein ES703_57621 [subsurface metagenome]
MTSKKKKKTNWFILAVILGIAFIIDLFVVDPIPFVDELILIFGTIFSFYKSLR